LAIPTSDENGDLSSIGTTAEVGVAISFPGFGKGNWDIGGYATHGTAAGVGVTGGLAGGYTPGGSVSDLSTHGDLQVD
jgi:hypothetical protein